MLGRFGFGRKRSGKLDRRFDFRVECGVASHIGLVRTSNEDAWHADGERHVFIVADGMGGHAAGEVAAALTLKTTAEAIIEGEAAIASFVESPSLDARRSVFATLQNAAERAHLRVRQEAERSPDCSGMGSTLDVVLLAGERAFIFHIGDGRVYLVRRHVTIQTTHDHDARAALGVKGSLPPPSRTSAPNRLLSAVGIGETVVGDCVSFDLESGDRLILCTDGIHQMIGDENTIGRRGGKADATANALVELALEKGGRDNATALVVDVHESLLDRKKPAHVPSRDLAVTLASPLLENVTKAHALKLLSAMVEVEVPDGRIPRVVTRDRVAYIVLDGEVERSDGAHLGAGAVLYAESLVDARRPTTYRANGKVRALRLRADDFREVCSADLRVAAELYERLARHLAHIGSP